MHVLSCFGAISREYACKGPYSFPPQRLARLSVVRRMVPLLAPSGLPNFQSQQVPDRPNGGVGRRANLGLARRRFWWALLAGIAGAKDLVGGAEDALGGTLGECLALAP